MNSQQFSTTLTDVIRGGESVEAGSLMVAGADMRAGDRMSDRWGRLAAVARERAFEQSAKAAIEPDAATAGPHLEQQAYLVKLAELYEERARTV